MLKNHVFGSFNLNNSEKHMLSFEDIFLGRLDTYTKKMNPPSAVLGGGVHGKVCWLMAYYHTAVESECNESQRTTLPVPHTAPPTPKKNIVPLIPLKYCICFYN